MKKRHTAGIDLGSVASSGSSAEADLSSMDSALVYVTTGSSSGNSVFALEAAPEDFGETPTWGLLGTENVTLSASTSRVLPMQRLGVMLWSGAHATGSTTCPRRFRVRHISGSTIESVWVEGVRSVA